MYWPREHRAAVTEARMGVVPKVHIDKAVGWVDIKGEYLKKG